VFVVDLWFDKTYQFAFLSAKIKRREFKICAVPICIGFSSFTSEIDKSLDWYTNRKYKRTLATKITEKTQI